MKKAALTYGAGAVGVAPVNERWFYSKDRTGKPIVFSDTHKEPTVADDGLYIPKSMNRIIVMLHPQDPHLMDTFPSALAVSASVGWAASKTTDRDGAMAEFVRGLGYFAIAMADDTSLSIPIAIDAGLGELGRNGLLINPVYGSNMRISKILTDLPLTVDKPISFGAAEFCKTCMKCAEECPVSAISADIEPTDKLRCPSNNRGMTKWYVDAWSCLKYSTQAGGIYASDCTVCQFACPYSKPNTWIHTLAKTVPATTSAMNYTLRDLDDTFGYGKNSSTAKEWWANRNDPKWWNYKV